MIQESVNRYIGPRLLTLGTVGFTHNSEALATGGDRETALLVILAVEQGRGIRRDTLVKALWPQRAKAKSKHSLRQLIYSLRRRFPTLEMHSSPDGVRIARGTIAVDVHLLSELCAAGDYIGASDVYRGPFLDGFGIELPEAFHDWKDAWSAKAALSAGHAMAQVLAEAENSADWSTAAQTALRLCRLDPFNDTYQERAVRAAALLGGADAVSRVFRIVKPTRRALGILLGSAGKALAAARSAPDIENVASGIPFVGRTQEFRTLKSTLKEASAGRPSITLVQGDAGIGKTRCCLHFLRYAAIGGARILHAVCSPALRNHSLSAVLAAIRSGDLRRFLSCLDDVWKNAVAALLPEWRAVAETPAFDSYRLADFFEALSRLLDAASTGGPLVMFLDDISWADEASLDLLILLASRPDSRLMILVSDRTGDVCIGHERSSLHGLTASRHSRQILLHELDEADAMRLLAGWEMARGVCLTPEQKKVVWARTKGQPYFILEILESALAARSDQRQTAVSDTALIATPATVRALIAGRLRALSPPAFDCLLALSTGSRPCTLQLIRTLLQNRATDIQETLQELEDSRLIHKVGDVFAPAHGVIVDVIRNMADSRRRTLIHLRWAEILAQEGRANAAEVADHLESAGNGRMAFPYLLEAASASLSSPAFKDGENLLRRARAVAPTQEDALDVDIQLMTVLWNGRRFAEAYAIGRIRRDAFVNSGRVDLACRVDALAILTAISEPQTTAEDLFLRTRRGAASFRRSLPAVEWSEILCSIVEMAHEAGKREFLRKYLPTLRSEAGRMFDAPDAAARVLVVCALATAVYQDAGIAVDIARTAQRLADSGTAVSTGIRARFALGSALYCSGAIKEGEEALAVAAKAANVAGLTQLAFDISNNLAVVWLESGRIFDAQGLLERVVERTSLARSLVALANLAFAAVELNDLRAVERWAAAIRQRNGVFQAAWADVIASAMEGLVAMRSGAWHLARTLGIHVIDSLRRGDVVLSDPSYVHSFLGEASVRLGGIPYGHTDMMDEVARCEKTHLPGSMRLRIAALQLYDRRGRPALRDELASIEEMAFERGCAAVAARAGRALKELDLKKRR